MDHKDHVIGAENVDHLKIRAVARPAPDAPFSIANFLRPWGACVIHDVFRVLGNDTMVSDVIDVPGVPSKFIHEG